MEAVEHEHCYHDLHWESAVCCVCMQNFAAAHDVMLAALRAVEWGASGEQCPSCLSYKEEGHINKCQLDAAIAKGEAT